MKRRVCIVGAGLAGLAAAIRLLDAGFAVTLVERHRIAGGRARRIRAGGEWLDYGQHLLMGCYHRTFEFARRLGSLSEFERIEERPAFAAGAGRMQRFGGAKAPEVLHALATWWGLSHLSVSERIRLLAVVAGVKAALVLRPGRLDALTAMEFLSLLAQTPETVRKFLGPLCSATINLPPAEASALLFATVLDRAFLGSAKDATPILPRTTLYDALVEPALRVLSGSSADVFFGERVVRVAERGEVHTDRARQIQADAVVVAVAPWDLVPFAGESGLRDLAARAERLGESPIVSAAFWYERPILPAPIVGVLDGPIQWLFQRASRGVGPARVCAVVSHADEWRGVSNAILTERFRDEIRRLFPDSREVRELGSSVLKVHPATFRAAAGQAAIRPGPRTARRDVFLAGDWTATGLPATIEGAVQSGFEAARRVMES